MGKVRGEVEVDDGVLVLRRIHVVYTLRTSEDNRETAERVHDFHARFCPVFRSLEAAIEITTELGLEVE